MSKRQRSCTKEDLSVTPMGEGNDRGYIPESGKYINMRHPPHSTQAGRLMAEILRVNSLSQFMCYFSTPEYILAEPTTLVTEAHRYLPGRKPNPIFGCWNFCFEETYIQRVSVFMTSKTIREFVDQSFSVTENEHTDFTTDFTSDVFDALWEDFDEALDTENCVVRKYDGDDYTEVLDCVLYHNRFLITERFRKVTQAELALLPKLDSDSHAFDIILISDYIQDFTSQEEMGKQYGDRFQISVHHLDEFFLANLGRISQETIIAALTISCKEREEVYRRGFIPMSGSEYSKQLIESRRNINQEVCPYE